MVRVAPVNLTYNPHVLWFDPGDIEVHKGDAVIVETSRGIEFGRAASEVIDVSKNAVKKTKSKLRPVRRIASDEDIARAEELDKRSREALDWFKEQAARVCPDMRPVAVEFLFDGDKGIFYFESENRVDFRDLVRRLACSFHVRIDMRQIGVRDEARMAGGFGHCGQELCCVRLGGNFNPVSIRMAKTQDLSLNQQKISGLCGRLLCCLRYENDTYKDVKSRAPKVGSTVQTPQGPAKVVDLDAPREIVSVRFENEKSVRVPLGSFDPPEKDERPHVIGETAWEEAQALSNQRYDNEPATFLATQLEGSDKLAKAGSVRHVGKQERNDAPLGTTPGKSSRKRGKKSRRKNAKGSQEQRDSQQNGSSKNSSKKSSRNKARRRRSTKISSGTAEAQNANKSKAAEKNDQRASQKGSGKAGSSGKGASNGSGKGQGGGSGNSGKGKANSGDAQGNAQKNNGGGQGSGGRRRRRRRRNRGSKSSSGGSAQKQGGGSSQKPGGEAAQKQGGGSARKQSGGSSQKQGGESSQKAGGSSQKAGGSTQGSSGGE